MSFKNFLIIFIFLFIKTSNSEHFLAKTPTKETNPKSLSKINEIQSDVKESSDIVNDIELIILSPIAGAMLLFFSLILLWKNERSYVITCQRLERELSTCSIFESSYFNNKYDGCLVCVKGLISSDVLADNDFPSIKAFDAIKFVKSVEMYQWNEKRKLCRTEHEYSMVWSEKFINSEVFLDNVSHKNDEADFLRKSEEVFAENIRLEEYFLSEELKNMIKTKIPLSIPLDAIEKADPKLISEIKKIGKEIHIKDNCIYISKDKTQNNIGDLRFKFEIVKCDTATIVSKLNGKSFTKHVIQEAQNPNFSDNRRRERDSLCEQASELTKPLEEIHWIFEKKIESIKEIQEEIKEKYLRKRDWIRLLGWVSNWGGIALVFTPFYVVLTYIPFFLQLGSISYLWILLSFALITGTFLSIIVISLAWLFYRPVLSIILIVLSITLGVGINFA